MAESLQFDYNPLPTLETFHASNALIKGVRGPVGSGKTVGCCMDLVKYSCLQEPYHNVRYSKFAMVRNTYQELLQTTLETWTRWFGDYSHIRRTPPIEAKMIIELADKTLVNIWLLFLALDRPDDVKKLKSLEVTGSFLNEASEMGRWVLTRCFERRGRYPDFGPEPKWAGVIMDTNSCDDDHWWYKASEEENNQGWEFYNQPSALLKFTHTERKPAKVQLEEYLHKNPDYQKLLEKNYRSKDPKAYAEKISRKVVKDLQGNLYIANPEAENAENLPLGYDYWLDQVPGKPLDEITVYILNQYGTVTDSKAVYPEYNEGIHVAKQKLKAIPDIGITLGFDFGRTPACTLSQITPRGQKRVIEEHLVVEHGSMGIRLFSRTILVPHLLENYLDWLIEGLFEGYGDKAGTSREQTGEKTCFMLLNECPTTFPKGEFPDYEKNRERLKNQSWVKKLKKLAKRGMVSIGDLGIKVRPARTNSFEARVDAVSNLLTSFIDNEPAILISPDLRYLRKGMRGKYCYKRVLVSGPDARYKDEPDKNIYCVPSHTEALTPFGWKKYYELLDKDSLLYGVEFKNGKPNIVLTKSEKVNLFDGKFEIFRHFNSTIDFLSSENHRHFIKTKNGVWKYVKTKDLKSGNHIVGPVPKYEAPKKSLFTRDFISVAGWVFAEGHYRDDGSIILVQDKIKNHKYCEYLSSLLSQYSYVNKNKDGSKIYWRITKDLAVLLRLLMPEKIPSFEFVEMMNNKDRRLFLYEFLRGDGNCSNGISDIYMPNKNEIKRLRDFWVSKQTTRAFQSSKEASDIVQMIACLCGISTTIRPKEKGFHITFNKSIFHDVRNLKTEKVVENLLWCPTTKTGNWICRQNGRVFITGNSHINEGLQYDCLESSFFAVDPDKKKQEDEKEHRKNIGTASCAAWDELAAIKESIANGEYEDYIEEMSQFYH